MPGYASLSTFRLVHSCVCTAFKVYSTTDERGWASSIRGVPPVDSLYVNIQFTSVMLYLHHPHDHKNWAGHGQFEHTSADTSDNGNSFTQTVRRLSQNADGQSTLCA